jgi:hypothetical protein
VCRTRSTCVMDHSQALTDVCNLRMGKGGWVLSIGGLSIGFALNYRIEYCVWFWRILVIYLNVLVCSLFQNGYKINYLTSTIIRPSSLHHPFGNVQEKSRDIRKNIVIVTAYPHQTWNLLCQVRPWYLTITSCK